MPKYTVHREAPEAARADLERIWTDNLPVGAAAADKFRWLYEAAPNRSDAVFMLRADGEAVGTAGVLTRVMHVFGEPQPVGVLADLAVDRAHRSLLPALRLVREVRAQALQDTALVYGFPNHLAEGVFRRAGYAELGRTTRFVRVLRHARYADRVTELARVPKLVARAVEHPALARISGALVDAGRFAGEVGGLAQAFGAYTLAWPALDDARFDALWREASGEYPIVAVRDAALLSWRFARSEARSAILLRRRDGAPRACAVIERVGDVAHVRDLFGYHDALAPLLHHLSVALYVRGACSMSLRYLGSPRVVAILEALGFRPRERDRMISVGVGPRLAARTAEIEDASCWHLLDLDEDV